MNQGLLEDCMLGRGNNSCDDLVIHSGSSQVQSSWQWEDTSQKEACAGCDLLIMSTVWLGGHLEALVFARMVIFIVIFSYFRGHLSMFCRIVTHSD